MKSPRFTPLFLPALALFALGLGACKPSAGGLDELSFPQECFASDKKAVEEEARDVLRHYLETGDALYASPHYRITMLHIAAMTHRLGLVRRLLDEGADPNAVMLIPFEHYHPGYENEAAAEWIGKCIPAAPPIIMATRLYAGGNSYDSDAAQDALHVVRALVEAGANLNFHDPAGAGVLSCCTIGTTWGNTPWQDTALALLDLGATPTRTDALCAADRGCYRLLKRLLEREDSAAWRHAPELMHELAEACFFLSGRQAREDDGGFLDCAKLIMASPMPVNASNERRHPPLWASTFHLGVRGNEDIGKNTSYLDFLCMLLQQGADPHLPGSDTERSTAADFIAGCPPLQKALAERGFNIEPPPHRFTRDNLLAELCNLPHPAVRDEEVSAQWDALASVFTDPAEEVRLHGGVHQSLAGKVLLLMQRADATRLRETLLARPCWREPAAWQGEPVEPKLWLNALRTQSDVVLPSTFLRDAARVAQEGGSPASARHLVRLMERCPAEETAALLDELAAEGQPVALRAPAWSVKLHREGLPALAGNEIRQWLDSRPAPKGASTYEERYAPAVSQAQQAEEAASRFNTDELSFNETSMRYMYRGDEKDIEKEQTITALRTVGATLAAELLPRVHILPDEQKIAAALELELALALHIDRHREAFLHPELVPHPEPTPSR